MTASALTLLLLCTAPPSTKPARLRFEPTRDVAVTAAMAVSFLGTEALFKHALAPTACVWCTTNAFDDSVRRVFHPSLAPSAFGVPGPDLASSAIGFALVPLTVLGLNALWGAQSDAAWQEYFIDAVVVLESTLSAVMVNQVTKFMVGRARPYTIGASDAALAGAKDPTDHNLSFFSGHTTFSVGLAVSAGMVASLRGYPYAWVTWLVGVPLAFTTALLRLGADKHWASDVLVGVAVGAGSAVALTLLLHGREDHGLTVGVGPGGVSLSGRF